MRISLRRIGSPVGGRTGITGRVKLNKPIQAIIALLSILPAVKSLGVPAPGTRLNYWVLSAQTEVAPPFAAVDFIYGPKEAIKHREPGLPKEGQWWQLEIRTNTNGATTPLCLVRGLTVTDPLAGQGTPRFVRYQVRFPETGEALEYVEARSGLASCPRGWTSRGVSSPV